MNIQSVKRVLLAITAGMVASLVLIPQVAFCQGLPGDPDGPPVVIDIYNNACKFRDIDGGWATVYSPDNIKVVQRGNKPPKGTCEDASIVTEEGESLYFEGYAMLFLNGCVIKVDDTPTLYSADYQQTIDENGTTLTCEGVEPPKPPPCRDHKACGD